MYCKGKIDIVKQVSKRREKMIMENIGEFYYVVKREFNEKKKIKNKGEFEFHPFYLFTHVGTIATYCFGANHFVSTILFIIIRARFLCNSCMYIYKHNVTNILCY